MLILGRFAQLLRHLAEHGHGLGIRRTFPGGVRSRRTIVVAGRRRFGRRTDLAESGQPGGKFFMRLANPLIDEGPGEWRPVITPVYTPEELLEQAHGHERIFPPGMLTDLLG
jgi:hypothetical protein